MKNAKPERFPSLFRSLTVGGAAIAGITGILTGGVLGRISAIPVTAAAMGYSIGGWASAITGLALGGAANFWPLYKKSETMPVDEPHSPVIEKYETVCLGDYAGNACAFAGGIAGAFTGAAMGAGLAGIVTIAETRQTAMNGTMPDEAAARRKDRDNGPFIH